MQTEIRSSPVQHQEIWSAHQGLGSVRSHLDGDHCCHGGSGVERGILGFLLKNIEYKKLKCDRITHSINKVSTLVSSDLIRGPKH